MFKVCTLLIYGDMQSILIADTPLSLTEWEKRIDNAAKRYDDIEDNGAEVESRAEHLAILQGLTALICHRHPDIHAEAFVEVAPAVPGWRLE